VSDELKIVTVEVDRKPGFMKRQRDTDMRYCGICWAGRNGVRSHYCDEPLGHGKDGSPHRCHCGETLKVRPLEKP
jgi:hypothetical protein